MNTHRTWKAAVLALTGLIAIATLGLDGRARGHRAWVDTSAGLPDCSVQDPFSPCYDFRHGYPAHDLFVVDDY